MCYEYDPGKNLYIIPDQLPKELEDEPELDPGGLLGFVMKFDYLPSSIISRLMLRFKNDIPAGCQWKYGMVLENGNLGCRGKVVADEENKTMPIKIQGDLLQKREYFYVIRHAIHDICSEFENLEVTEYVPLPGHAERLVGYRELLGYEKAGKDEYFNGELGRSFSVSEMLDCVISKSDRTREAHMPNITIDISNIGNPKVHVQQEVSQTATQHQTVSLEIKSVNGLFRNLKEDILDEIDIELDDEKEKKRIRKELEKADTAFTSLEKAAGEGKKEIDEGTRSRIAEFIDNLSDESSRLNKALKLVSKGAEKAQKLGKTYNKIAPFFGLPVVPPILLGD